MRKQVDVRRTKRSDLVADEIKHWFMSEGLQIGSRLPQERELMEIFGVSKGTIRECLKSLEVQGLIRVNTGPTGGAVISEVSYEITAELLSNYFFFKELDVRSIYQVRKLLEPELAASAVARLTDAQIDELKRTVEICRPKPKSDRESQVQRLAELSFHNILADASPNKMLSFMCRFINNYLSDQVSYRKLYSKRQENIRLVNLRYHESLVCEIVKRDEKKVEEEMRRHMIDCECHVVEMDAVVTSRFLKRYNLSAAKQSNGE
jgi:GntR family transcriptional regulator, transcriptional repressor for pyruvate dehydrogenase complex